MSLSPIMYLPRSFYDDVNKKDEITIIKNTAMILKTFKSCVFKVGSAKSVSQKYKNELKRYNKNTFAEISHMVVIGCCKTPEVCEDYEKILIKVFGELDNNIEMIEYMEPQAYDFNKEEVYDSIYIYLIFFIEG